MQKARIAIIGSGTVGSTLAYTLIMKNSATEILLIDSNENKCRGEIYDLEDSLSFSNVSHVRQARLKEASECDIIVITAGVPQKPGQTRIDLLKTNQKIVTDIISQIEPINRQAIIIIVTNPVDIMTSVVQNISGLAKHQVFGSGTMLDTQRLRALIAQKINIAQQSIHAYILGEHGDSQFFASSHAYIAGTPLNHYVSETELNLMLQKAKSKAYDIIACKGSTAFGVAACVAAYCDDIVFDTKRIMPLSTYIEAYDVCLSMPAVLGRQGIQQVLIPQFDQHEQENLEKSVRAIKKYMQEV